MKYHGNASSSCNMCSKMCLRIIKIMPIISPQPSTPRTSTKCQMPRCLILSHLAILNCRASLIRLTCKYPTELSPVSVHGKMFSPVRAACRAEVVSQRNLKHGPERGCAVSQPQQGSWMRQFLYFTMSIILLTTAAPILFDLGNTPPTLPPKPHTRRAAL